MTLERGILARPAVEVAPLLLGALLGRAGVLLRITEVEAYLGEGVDPGSHAFRGRTRRNASMFGPHGHVYAYFSYGMHVCANVVCSPEGEASAVLLRAGEIVAGLPEARMRRPTSRSDRDLARGPARLTLALGLGLGDDGADLELAPFTLTLPEHPVPFRSGPRTGVGGAGGGADYPWRFWIPGEASVSPYRPHPKLTAVPDSR
ncbi:MULTISPECIES: DNA-3-methyladenine glycosylase [Cryobacterium]|uniref:Putative 3-methyladenine DNA glycosylase n=1 Tax=Cryobacterium breve TaxID=1259258 RepID=A0ABY2J977_9MICO|nr:MULTISPECIES: DNA-3-methyladenine glycosylase [Cryobacterium]TFC97760.1 DNA-3-methyladenine glycosylase [Cryobacterium sp. TmT3-12]TFD01508.1 DNA-3-methyladenine glycosylase [Cryobacterium breve]